MTKAKYLRIQIQCIHYHMGSYMLQSNDLNHHLSYVIMTKMTILLI